MNRFYYIIIGVIVGVGGMYTITHFSAIALPANISDLGRVFTSFSHGTARGVDISTSTTPTSTSTASHSATETTAKAAPKVPTTSVVPKPKQSDVHMVDDGTVDVVSYTSAGFNEKSITISTGSTLEWRNASDHAVWIVSVAPLYPVKTKSDCGTSSFDSCKKIIAGDSYTFTFDKAGTWHYENKLDPTQTGTVVVK